MKLPEALKDFEVVKPFVQQNLAKSLGGGRININTLTAQKADELISKGWNYLKRKSKPKRKAEDS